MSLGFKKRWLLLLPIAVLAIAVAVGVSSNVSPAFAQGGVMSLDGDPSTGAIDSVTPATAVGDTVPVSVTIDSFSSPWTTYQWEISFDATKLDFVTGTGAHVSPATACGAFTEGTFGAGPLIGDDFVNTACGSTSGPVSYTGNVDTFDMQCLAPSPVDPITGDPTGWPLHLVTTAEDGTFGTTIVGEPSMTLNDLTVFCEYQSDWQITKADSPDPVVAGGTITYTITDVNGGPNASVGAVVADMVPIEKVVEGTPGVSDPPAPPGPPAACVNPVPFPAGVSETVTPPGGAGGAGILWCETMDYPGFGVVHNIVIVDYSGALFPGPGTPVVINPGDVIQVTILADVPLSDAGKSNVNVALGGDLVNTDPDPSDSPLCTYLEGMGLLPPSPDNSAACEQTDVSPADLSITKTPDMTQYSVNDTITWTVTVTSNGPSPASEITISDTAGANQTVTGASMDVAGTCGYVGNVVTCTPDDPLAVGASIDVTITADVVDSLNNLCVNDASVEWADPLSADVHATVPCFPPTVRMEKDADTDPLDIDNAANLWICEGPTCTLNGEGSLTIYERVVNVGNDPDGAGAFEFQVKYDHKLFSIDVEPTDWLSNGGTRDVNCDLTIMTENWILFGCVSSGPTPGQTAAGVMATITVTPTDDMVNRLTPGQDNGVSSVILDENCEIADVLGDPLMLQDEFGNDIGLAPGVMPGGQIEVCSDIRVTIRILEADLNLDCTVDVLDQQAIAFRYGAFFGMLLYDKWYDLEPAIKDFDIDIKDLQKVWGRDGSVCGGIDGTGSIPPQPPVPFD